MRLSPFQQLLTAATILGCTAFGLSRSLAPAGAPVQQIRQGFSAPPDDTRVLMRWWWFGGAVEQAELERELRVMKDAGIGGVEIQPVYPLALDDPAGGIHNLPYLSDGFLKNIAFVSTLTKQLGMRMDVTLGSGWPFGGPNTPISEAAGKLRIERVVAGAGDTSVPVPPLENGERLIGSFLAKGERRDFSSADTQQLPPPMDGRVPLPVRDSAPHVVLFFIGSHTGQQVKRASIGAEGYVLDHYNRTAIEHHLQAVADPLLKSFGAGKPYAVFSDSLEVFGTDWTGNFLAEFKKRRGYDLGPLLPLLAADGDGRARAVRHDWGQTLTELAEANYLTPIREWAHEHGTLFRSQTYGEPPAILSSNEGADLPEGEAGPRWRTFSTARWASSASHIYGRAVTSSETWTWLHSPAFRATPLDLKAEADLHFLQGITQLVGHGWPYSPKGNDEPGWRFYAAGALNDHNPWFPVMPELTLYLQRLSYLLRQGQAANDIAVYLPTDDAWANFKPGKASVDRQMETLLGPDLIPQILDAGYNFDFVDDRAIESKGLPWKAVILPGVERMPPKTALTLQRFMKDGGKVFVTRRLPALAPGLTDAADSAQIADIFRSSAMSDEATLGSQLNKDIPADFLSSAKAVGFVHRKLPNADIYFAANTSNQSVSGEARFRDGKGDAEVWDPFSGATRKLEVKSDGQYSSFNLRLAPYASRVFVFSRDLPTRNLKTTYHLGAGSTINLDDNWRVTFGRNSRPSAMPHLHSWADDEATRFYSGDAIYERSFALAEPVSSATLDFGPGQTVEASGPANAPGMRALLESPVREAAIVFVNGKRAGSVWHPPFALEIANYLHTGSNQLRIAVYNSAINEIAGRSLPSYKLLNLRYGERFMPQGFENIAPLPSGILGPVRLLVMP